MAGRAVDEGRMSGEAGRSVPKPSWPGRLRRWVVDHLAEWTPPRLQDALLLRWEAQRPDAVHQVLIQQSRLEAPPAVEVPLRGWHPALPLKDFADLIGLFRSHTFTQGICRQPIAQAAYVYSWIRRHHARRVLEIGRWHGGGTLVLATAMQQGWLWSMDLDGRSDALLEDLLRRAYPSLQWCLLRGNSTTMPMPAWPSLDVVMMDGSHDYEDVLSDLRRFAPLVSPDGAIFLDDAAWEPPTSWHRGSPGVRQALRQWVATAPWTIHRQVERLVHLSWSAAPLSS